MHFGPKPYIIEHQRVSGEHSNTLAIIVDGDTNAEKTVEGWDFESDEEIIELHVDALHGSTPESSTHKRSALISISQV